MIEVGIQARIGGPLRAGVLTEKHCEDLNPRTGRGAYVSGNCIFFTDSPPVPRLPVLLTLFAGVPNPGREEGRQVLGSLGECPPSPRWAEGEADIFLGLSPGRRRGHLAGLLFGTRDWGGANTDFQAGPAPPSRWLTGARSSSWPPPARA